MTAEQQYLRELVRAWAAGRTAPVPLTAGAAAETVLNLLAAHQVEAALGALLPADVAGEGFGARLSVARNRSEALLLELERLWPALANAGGDPVALKGAALALGTYWHPSDRWFMDLDVLVAPEAVERTCAALVGAGYGPLQGGRDSHFYEKYHLHRIMVGPQGAIVEVHWALTLPGSVYRHDVDAVRDRSEWFPLGRCSVRCAGPVDLILHGVYQHIADGFVDLRRVLDFVALYRRLTPSDWETLVVAARRGGTARALWVSLHVVKQISQISPPLSVMSDLDPGWVTRRTVSGLRLDRACLRRTAARQSGYAQMVHLLLTPTAGERWREAVRSLRVDEAALLDEGFEHGQRISFIQRSKKGLYRSLALIRAIARLLRASISG